MSSATNDEKFDLNANLACETAENFCDMYYKTMDNHRHVKKHHCVFCTHTEFSRLTSGEARIGCYSLLESDRDKMVSCIVKLPHKSCGYRGFNCYEPEKMKGFYLDTAVMVWNGNHVSGNADIVKFLENLPSSEHIAEAVDAQPLMDSLSPGKLTTLATVKGSSKFHNNKATTFMQSFTLTSVNNVLKIVSDSVRFFE